MTKKTRQDWFTAGLGVLAESGHAALTIDRLADRLGITKGSFYHHFADFADYKHCLIAMIEAAEVDTTIAQAQKAGTPAESLQLLLKFAEGYSSAQALALQAWALHDPDVRALQQRVYRRQLDYTATVLTRSGLDTARARLMAGMAYSIVLGSMHLHEHLPKHALRQFFKELEQLIKS